MRPLPLAPFLDRIAAHDPGLSAFRELHAPPPGGTGVPLAVKGAHGLRSEAAQRLLAAGAVSLGATATPGPGTVWQTWGLGAHGPTLNPWRPDRTPGGSSAGAAVAVATGMAAVATAGDGAGSIRIPAAWCGVFGLKTTRGLLRSPDRTRLATAGILTRTAAEAAPYLRHVLPGPPTAPRPLRHAVYSPDLGFARVDEEIAAVTAAAVHRIDASGAVRVDPADDPPFALRDPAPAWLAVRAGAPTPATDALRAGNDHRIDALLRRVPLLLTPTTPNPPHGHEGPGERYSTDLTWAFNLSGHPAATVHAGFTADGCPVGLQLVAAHGSDAVLAATAALCEAALDAVPCWPDRATRPHGTL
ncbi:amidase family protein [Streptomyces sp. NPDC050504]|uniref:amidase family protein n=1 Tax=Streptomyces sp. NPDC050504 TaxID=3365618 RepID=UPI0037ACED07